MPGIISSATYYIAQNLQMAKSQAMRPDGFVTLV